MAKKVSLEIPFLKKFVSNKVYNSVIKFANDAVGKAKKSQPSTKDIFRIGADYYVTQGEEIKYVQHYNPDTISYSTYEKMSNDFQIFAGLQMIKLPIGQVRWDIKCKDKKIKSFLVHELSRVFRNLVKNMLTAIDYGFAPHEKIWQLKENYSFESQDKITMVLPRVFILKQLRLVKPETIVINRTRKTQDFSGLTQYNVGTIDADKSFLYSHDVQYGNLYGRSRLKSCYEPWYWSHLIVAFCNRFHETYAKPPIIAKAPIGDTKTGTDDDGVPILESNIQIMQNIAESIQEQTAVTLPALPKDTPQFSLDVLKVAQTGGEFLKYLRLLDVWKLRGMFVPETIVGQPYDTGGSYGLARTHTKTFLKAEEDLAFSLIDTINKQIIPYLIKYNFSSNKQAEMIYLGFSDELRAFLQKIFLNMILKGDAIPSAEALAEELGIPGKISAYFTTREREKGETRGAPGVPKPSRTTKPPFEPASTAREDTEKP